MGFESFSEIATKQRKSKGRSMPAPTSLVSITQNSYADKKRRTVMTIRLSREAMKRTRLKHGDKVDIGYD